VRYETLRILLAWSVLKNWDIEALDVKTAFLYGDLDEEIYMQQPEGFVVKGSESKVYKLKKAIYGLKQASYAWNQQAYKSLKNLGFDCLVTDSGIYVRNTPTSTTVCVMYVDDILFMGNNDSTIKETKQKFMKMWECRDLGKVTEYLRININYNRNLHLLVIDQSMYTRKIVKRFGLENCKPVRTPLPTGYSPLPNEGECTKDERSYYQQIIGSLLYLALGTRPDIIFAVIMMSQFSANPSSDHTQKALYIVKYVAHTLDAKIVYNGSKKTSQEFYAYADADWAADRIGRISVSGYIMMLAGGAVAWTSRKQKTIALSSTEVEYMSLSDAARQITWVQSLMSELGITLKSIELLVDNQGAIFWASNPAQEQSLVQKMP
jgi:hypothetical protein